VVSAADTGSIASLASPASMTRWLVLAVAAERAVELLVSSRNARRLRRRGAVEAGRGHYPAMVAFHAALLVACAAEPALLPGPWPAPVALSAGAAVLLAQGLRWWAVATLGGRWTTRVLVLPGAPPVRSGPYRWLRHPNYLAVAVEVLCLPLATGAWRTALVATVLDAVLLRVRIRAEERALGEGFWRAFERAGGAGAGQGTRDTAGHGTRGTGDEKPGSGPGAGPETASRELR
jgi:methyltransferase